MKKIFSLILFLAMSLCSCVYGKILPQEDFRLDSNAKSFVNTATTFRGIALLLGKRVAFEWLQTKDKFVGRGDIILVTAGEEPIYIGLCNVNANEEELRRIRFGGSVFFSGIHVGPGKKNPINPESPIFLFEDVVIYGYEDVDRRDNEE